MGFRFSLAPVLEQRHAVEDRAQREHGEALARLETLRREKSRIEDEMARRKCQARDEQAAGLPLYRRELIENWIRALEHNLRELEPELYRQIARTEQLRLKLVNAMRDRLIMEKLREEEWAEFRRLEERAERRQFDEIAIRNFVMERREKSAACEPGYPERIAG